MSRTATFDYYYGMQAEAYIFYRIPKILFTDPFFKKLSCEAKVLYGLMLDRMSLSVKNKWFDEQDRVYIIFTIDDAREMLGCCKQTAVNLMAELDTNKGIGLIEKKRLGLGKANIIYVKNFMIHEDGSEATESPQNPLKSKKQTSGSPENRLQEVQETDFRKSENQTSESPENGLQEVCETDRNNTDINKTDVRETDTNQTEWSETQSNQSDSAMGGHNMTERSDEDEIEIYYAYQDLVKENIEYDILCHDTLYIYDGGSINSPLLTKINNCYASNTNSAYSISSTNTEKMLTIRFRSTIDTANSAKGFHLVFQCQRACEKVVAYIENQFERTDMRGNVISALKTKQVPDQFDTLFVKDTVTVYDTVWDDTNHITFHTIPRDSIFNTDSVIRVDTVSWVEGALICQGQGIIFHGHGTYTNNTGWYTPHDTSSIFNWNFTIDTLNERGATAPFFNGYRQVDCYDVTLVIEDENGCKSNNLPKIQVRIAQNPIKTIYDLTPVCSADSLSVSVGYDGDNGTLTLKKIEQITRKSKVNQVRTFIPDGPRCSKPCYDAPVTFNEFGSKKVTSAADICSICVRYEHSFMGDYELSIICPIYDELDPTGPGKAVLKYKEKPSFPIPDGTDGGGGRYTGVPYQIGGDDLADHMAGAPGCGGDNCDSADNPYGKGFNYCFSRNESYTLVNGSPADISPIPEGCGIASSTHVASYTYNQPAIPPGYCKAGQHAGPVTVTTKDSSDYINQLNYFVPASDFHELIGCPLDGTWKIKLCDYWAIDNGWVFSWGMDICGVSAGGIYDEFGCRWDTVTHISTVYTPTPHLGNDTILCGVNTIPLDARDKHSQPGISTFQWEPTGDTAGVIETVKGVYKTTTYVVQAINTDKGTSCPARDTIVVHVNPQPVPSFDPGVYPLEGCEPFTINIDNTTDYGYKYRWVFGDGTYSTLRNPSHSYAAGTYDLKYYVESDKGCKDSLIYTDLITVHSSPKASFSWEPVFPTVQHPSITLKNNTAPDNGSVKYFWEIQYDKDHPNSFQTMLDVNPTFEWDAPKGGGDVSGNYTIRLIARNDEKGPSGLNIACGDTVENTIIIINDMLQFPTVVTPNGDGINDRFVILNLVEGLAYPINTLDIYDKWGSRVFHATNISRDDQFWDPSKSNVPSGTYFYRFSGKGYQGNIEHNGVVEVLK